MAYSKQNFQNGQTLNAANLEKMENGIIAGQGVKNLLVNSNFKDPINSSGKTSWSASGFTIDKWRADSAVTVNLTSSGITVDATSVAGNFQQNIDNLPNGTYTFAALVNNVIRTIAFTNNNGTITTVDNSNASFGGSGSISAGKGSSAYYVQINNVQGHTNTIAWVALYEGNYTVDTLPNYIPKDKHIEMSYCGIPAQPHNLFDNSNFRNPVNSRGIINTSNAGYHIDRWKKDNASGTVTVGDDYIAMSGTGALWFLTQYISKNKIKSGTVYTIALADTSGSISVCSTVMSTGMAKFTAQHTFTSGAVVTTNVEYTSDKYSVYFTSNTSAETRFAWAALYEGFYTADTLPPYVPKDKNVEMVNCCVPLQPKNLLDNSDFRIKNNIINTKGLLDYSFDSGNVFDRWRLHWTGDGRVSIKDGYIELYRNTNSAYLFQHPRDLQSMVGKTYTVAAKVRYSGYIGWIDSTQRVNCGLLALNDWDIVTFTFTVGSATSDIGEAGIEIATKSNQKFQVQWIALYEGAYTLDTIPMYQSENKHIEMLNCNVHLAPHNLLDNSDFSNPVNSRGKNTYSDEGNEYTIDRWKTKYKSNISIENGYINIFGHWGLEQHIQNPKDGIYTFAARIRINNIGRGTPVIYVDDNSGSSNDLFLDANIGEWKTYILQHDFSSTTGETITFAFSLRGGDTTASISVEWAAMYKDAYTADTLPPYVPKGKHVEMLNCGVPLAPRNFLDNSDFSDPVNQLGKTSYNAAAKNNINRWETNLGNKSTITVGNGKITISKSATGGHFEQTIPVDLTGKMMTYAVKTANGIICKSAIISSSPSPAQIDDMNAYLRVYVSSGKTFFQIYFNTTDSITLDLYWAALYEGSYTADTLPSYVPKGKRVEMLNCGISLAPYNLLDNSDFTNPVNQRGKTSYGTDGYTIDRWYFYNPNGDGTVTINNGYISLTGGSGAVSLSCRFPKGFLDANKTYTARICDNLGNINPTGLVFYDSFDSFELSAGAGETKNIVWAALYEGSYDASTLPAYQPKGYAAELAECQRYYQTIPALTHIPGVTNTSVSFGSKYKIPTMRIAPTVSIASGQEVSIYTGEYSASTTNYTIQYATMPNQITLNVTLDTGSFVAYKPGVLVFPVDIALIADL